MKILLDTNIIIHREGNSLFSENIGKLFYWLDKLHCEKFVHFNTLNEIDKYKDIPTKQNFKRKLQAYSLISTKSALHQKVSELSLKHDKTGNDYIDTELLNEVMLDHIDILITEDRGIKRKAKELGLGSRVLNIFEFLERVISENPSLSEYIIQNVRLEKFGAIDVKQTFFMSFIKDYDGFEKWFSGKFIEDAYVCGDNEDINAFLYLKTEEKTENYNDIYPQFSSKKRLKIGTFKVTANGYRLGERFIKIICDNAIKRNVEEIYVTIFENEEPQKLLVSLLIKFGFIYWGTKGLNERKENVYIKKLNCYFDVNSILDSYPYIPSNRQVFFIAIENIYHTKLFPDSILKTEDPEDFSQQAGFSNAIRKCYITRSYSTMPKKGDILLFYRNGGMYKGVFTTLGIFEGVETFGDFNSFYEYASNRTVLSKKEMLEWWEEKYYKPKIIDFIYSYSFPKRLNLQQVIDLGFNKDIMGKGIQPVDPDIFEKLIKFSNMDMRYFSKNN